MSKWSQQTLDQKNGLIAVPGSYHLAIGPTSGSRAGLVTKQPDKTDDLSRAGTIQRLVKETGITEAEASDLLTLIGSDWSSLVREARLVRPKR